MPLYDYECSRCHKVTEHYKSMNDDAPVACPCGYEAVRIITTRFWAHGDLDYVDDNLGEQPVRVTSRKQRRRLMEKAGVSEAYGKGWI